MTKPTFTPNPHDPDWSDSTDAAHGSINRCPQCGDAPTYQTPDGTFWDGNAHFWRAPGGIESPPEPGAKPGL